MKMAIAQIHSKRQNILSNIKKHETYVKTAAQNQVDLIVFPELSITGYERSLAREQCFIKDDPRLNTLAELSHTHNMIIVVGVPFEKADKLYIASLIFKPNRERLLYCKNHLHEGEEQFYAEGASQLILDVKEEKVALSICYDIEIDDHLKAAAESKATVYVSSIFYSPKGVIGLEEKVKEYISRYSMDIAIINCTGDIWDSETGGGSMYWSNEHQLIGKCDTKETLMICHKINRKWSSKLIIY